MGECIFGRCYPSLDIPFHNNRIRGDFQRWEDTPLAIVQKGEKSLNFKKVQNFNEIVSHIYILTGLHLLSLFCRLSNLLFRLFDLLF